MADGSNFKSENLMDEEVAPKSGMPTGPRLSFLVATGWLIATIVCFALSVWCFKHGIAKFAPYWPLEWFIAILGSILLSSVIASWDKVQSSNTVGKNGKEPAWFSLRLALSQAPIVEFGIGVVVTYGLFLIFEAFEVAEAVEKVPSQSLMEEKSNIVRILLSQLTVAPPYFWYFVFLCAGLAVVISVPFARNKVMKAARKKFGDITESELTRKTKEFLHLETRSVPATEKDCKQVEDKVVELEELLKEHLNRKAELLTEIDETEASIDEKTDRWGALGKEVAAFETIADEFNALVDSAGDLSNSLKSQAFVTDGAESLRIDSVNFLGEVDLESGRYNAGWRALAAKAKTEILQLEKEIISLKSKAAALKDELAAILVAIKEIEAQLKLAKEFLAFCKLPGKPGSVDVPVWGIFETRTITKTIEPASDLAEFFSGLMIVLLTLNMFFIAPAIEVGHGEMTGIGSVNWVRVGFLLVVLAIIPMAQAMRAIKLTLAPSEKTGFFHATSPRAMGLIAAGLLVAFCSISLLLPAIPAPPVKPEFAPAMSELQLSCATGSGVPRANWSFGKTSSFDMIEHSLLTCEPTEPLDEKTTFVAVVGVASQEGNPDIEEKRAQSRADTLAIRVHDTNRQWTGPIIKLVVGKALKSKIIDVSQYNNPKLDHRTQRDLIVLRETRTVKPLDQSKTPAAASSNLADLPRQYALAGEHLKSIITSIGTKPISTEQVYVAPDEGAIKAMANKVLAEFKIFNKYKKDATSIVVTKCMNTGPDHIYQCELGQEAAQAETSSDAQKK
ncbi:hypothetical protein [Asticcacaulis benevestitus]|uniref:Uncharacterized protein n=1 Tax=Asticcacaulis benevestitus DSM 16100 = ATCC BAA-896 TaxID=1121022 RepID=V4P1E3_9CAUL|nr:hypothetical protein [Asticcacaulis benevestitus]ESQ87812.1 hypothetical protein ABENE_16805 [Asticcacaulis benevestitus DSM 16100 = ATCC BAA-896]